MRYIIPLLFLFHTFIISAQTFKLASIAGIPDQVVGAEIAKVIFKEAKLNVEIQPLPAIRAQQYSTGGILDGEVLRIYEFGEFNESVIRVPTPISSVITTAYTLKGSGISLNSVEDMKNYRVAVLRGILNVNEMVKDFTHVERLSTVENLMRFLKSGRADIVIAGNLGAKSIIMKMGYTDIIPHLVISEVPLYMYLHKKHESYITILDDVIKELTLSGELKTYREEFEAKYFKSGNISY